MILEKTFRHKLRNDHLYALHDDIGLKMCIMPYCRKLADIEYTDDF